MGQDEKLVDQVSIAVFSIDESLKLYRDILGFPLVCIEEVPSEKVRVAILSARDTRIELLEPTSKDSPISGFLEKRGEGVHHIAYRVEDIDKEIQKLSAQGVRFIEPLVRNGSEGAKIAFIHPKSAHGVLTEIVERK
ncbi:MAG: methylmalonyl-CoA epimerase [Bdellovibrionales bacterium]|nr:methylmalonyl-CoA epimerase [Bdellovibrionales bacterium]